MMNPGIGESGDLIKVPRAVIDVRISKCLHAACSQVMARSV